MGEEAMKHGGDRLLENQARWGKLSYRDACRKNESTLSRGNKAEQPTTKRKRQQTTKAKPPNHHPHSNRPTTTTQHDLIPRK